MFDGRDIGFPSRPGQFLASSRRLCSTVSQLLDSRTFRILVRADMLVGHTDAQGIGIWKSSETLIIPPLPMNNSVLTALALRPISTGMSWVFPILQFGVKPPLRSCEKVIPATTAETGEMSSTLGTDDMMTVSSTHDASKFSTSSPSNSFPNIGCCEHRKLTPIPRSQRRS